ncbi:uncharacterized protein LOC120179648 [Hibiscus syriacus]|uniref:uncharacterized protein LOC120179648 n=1 Tax=Hibiscus syriacus TaxID=106335 RepID=UPI001923EC44|nr:uncharacterized protein LOC120179648 [Hibiscus syriacus]
MEVGINSSWSFRKLLSMRLQASSVLASGAQSIKDIWLLIRNKEENVTWHKLIWFPLHISKYSIITWMAFLDRLPTKDRLIRMRFNIDDKCVFCNDLLETRDHLFLHCALASSLWDAVLNLNGIRRGSCSWDIHLAWASASWKGKSLLTTIMKLAWTTFTYTIWEERNKRIYQERSRSFDDLFHAIQESVAIQLRGRNINRNVSVNITLCNQWGIEY